MVFECQVHVEHLSRLLPGHQVELLRLYCIAHSFVEQPPQTNEETYATVRAKYREEGAGIVAL